MIILPSGKKRLAALNAAQPDRPWKSCRERRQCVMCDHVFRGSDAAVRRTSRGALTRLTCPSCGAEPTCWVRLGNPLTDERIWAEWESAIDLATLKLTEA